MPKPLISWLVPSFSQHNLRLVVLEHCLHVSVTKFWHKFASLQQINTPSSWDKFQNCCTDMYLIRFLTNFAVFCMFLWISQNVVDLPEFRSSTTARNIRSPDITTLTLLLLQQWHQTNSQPMLQLVKRGYHSNSLELKRADRKKRLRHAPCLP